MAGLYTRYPLYVAGNPQLRVFFPKFWMKLVRGRETTPPNVVTFQCPVEMTKFDIQNYLEKIYGVDVAQVNTFIKYIGLQRDHRNRRFKPKDDYKIAFVTLAAGQTFKFPDLFPKKEDSEEKIIEEVKQKQKESVKLMRSRGGVPSWFGI
ncbi:39S ribosomal protein L23, mitochondrial-like [Anneissia japonica]|uniref:39S ribosomal protein L23, mitochondrial-like n=1 Tax=Anneissia japonica TaxID=1529436 RepID=UPI00142560DC|nr:39S ribosomal protein L23, mitochondrial-like [Anneissia japonica]